MVLSCIGMLCSFAERPSHPWCALMCSFDLLGWGTRFGDICVPAADRLRGVLMGVVCLQYRLQLRSNQLPVP
jgi:hypothetical protein